MPDQSVRDYSSVTETPGDGISREAVAMMEGRYALTADLAAGQDLLEISCGTAQGLGWVTRRAHRVVGVDITHASLRQARDHYGRRIPFVQCDAQHLPFVEGSFDVVAIHEAIYYYADAAVAFAEARRVLRAEGILVVSTINPAWLDFNRSPFSTRYLSVDALAETLGMEFSQVWIQLAFPVEQRSLRSRVLSAVKRFAIASGLIPKTMKGKRLLKRLAYGGLVQVPAELTHVAEVRSAEPFGPNSDTQRFKVIYAFAKR